MKSRTKTHKTKDVSPKKNEESQPTAGGLRRI